MKIATTIELDTDQLMAVGLIQNGTFAPAKAKEVREFVHGLAMSAIAGATSIVADQRVQAQSEILKSLNIE